MQALLPQSHALLPGRASLYTTHLDTAQRPQRAQRRGLEPLADAAAAVIARQRQRQLQLLNLGVALEQIGVKCVRLAQRQVLQPRELQGRGAAEGGVESAGGARVAFLL